MMEGVSEGEREDLLLPFVFSDILVRKLVLNSFYSFRVRVEFLSYIPELHHQSDFSSCVRHHRKLDHEYVV